MTVPSPSLDASTVFLVSGGARGITARCVIKLARRYRCRFLLLGRSPLEPEPAWAVGAADEAALKRCAAAALQSGDEKPKPAQIRKAVETLLAGREIRATLAAVAAAGGTADYLPADVTDLPGLQAALTPHRERITGLIHGAGVLADKRIENKTAADFERVYAPKVQGLFNLLACVPAGQLHHLVLFSSVAGFYGNPGQADYALANEILNKTAHRIKRRHPACHVLVVDWGPWDGGMVTPELKRLLAERHVDVIPVEAGTDWLADALAAPNPAVQIVVGPALVASPPEPEDGPRTYRIRRRLTLEANPFLRDHVIGGHAVLPTVCAVAWIANACEQLRPGYTFFRSDDYRALKGIVFDGTEAPEYILDLNLLRSTREEQVFEGKIWSEFQGRPRYHYSARITLMRELPAPPTIPVDLTAPHPVPGSTLYTDTTLFHGPAFQGVEALLEAGPDSLRMRCRLPRVDERDQGQFPARAFNPYLTDVQLQSLLIWAKRTYGYGGLPLRIQSGEQFRRVEFGDPTYVRLTVRAANEHNLVADVLAHDADGRLYSRVLGAEITLSPRLNDLFKQNTL